MTLSDRKFDKKTLDIAIVIPTLNEEGFIGRLLDSIIRQTVRPRCLVVVDAYSKDETIKEIEKRRQKLPNLRVFRIPKSTISRQRNLGAKKTDSDYILFLDADMEFRGEKVLEKYFAENLKEKPDVASATTLPDSEFWKDKVYFKLEDLLFKVTQYFWPVVTARNLLVKRSIFNKVGGFDEDLAVAEDQDLAHRIIKAGGKLKFLNNVSLHTSTRRLKKEGRSKYTIKMFLFGIDILLHGRKKANINYEFGKFKKR